MSQALNPLNQAFPTIKLQTSKADFRKLDQLLSEGKWKEADQETTQLMLKYANREKEGYLDIDSCRNFPQEELRIIDQLWLKYSHDRFGFSVQKKIWVDNGGKLDENCDSDTYNKLGNKVGWRKGGDWLDYSDLTFSANAPQGHLPLGEYQGGMYVNMWRLCERMVADPSSWGGFVVGWGWRWVTLFSKQTGILFSKL